MSDTPARSTEWRLPQPEEISEREREDAMGAYLMMFAAWGIGLPIPLLGLVAAIIYFAINRKNSLFVAFHALQSLLTQIPVTVVNLGLVGWLVGILVTESRFDSSFFAYLIFAVILNLLYVILSLIAMARARKGGFYYMPVFGRLCFAHYYGPGARNRTSPPLVNRPPPGL